MRLPALLISACLCLSLAMTQAATRFSSAYTDLNTECYSEASGQSGSDPLVMCDGPGGYAVRVSYSAFGASLTAEKGKRISIDLGMVEGDYLEQPGRKLEWRLASGAPFAVILRVNQYKAPDNGENPFQSKYKTRTVLKVVGLAGFERIAGAVDVKTANANQKARALADAGYSQK